MNRAVPLILLLCAAPYFAPPGVAAELNYSLYVLGLPVADTSVRFVQNAPAYHLALRFATTGVVDMIVGDHLEEHTSGRFEGDRPFPAEYFSAGRLHGKDRSVGMSWRDGTPVITSITPPNNTEREDIPPALLAHSVNPLDALVLLLHQVALNGRCEGSSRAYDGRRLQLLEARTAGEEDVPQTGRSSFAGRALRCDFTDRTLGGVRLGDGRDDDLREHRGTIWLGQVFPGTQRLPVRASVETRWLGDATIYLTSATP